MDTLGARIRAARLNAGLTIRELSSRIGVSEPTIRNWETDSHAPRPDLAVKVERELGPLGLTDEPAPAAPPRAPTRQRHSTAPRLDEASTHRLLAEIGDRDTAAADALAQARKRIAELEAEIITLRSDNVDNLEELRVRFAARPNRRRRPDNGAPNGSTPDSPGNGGEDT